MLITITTVWRFCVNFLYSNSLVYDRNIVESSSKNFGNLRKFSENVREFSSSEIFWKWSEVLGKSSITPSSVGLQLEDMKFMFSWQEQYLTLSLSSLEQKIHTFSPPCNILYITSPSERALYWPQEQAIQVILRKQPISFLRSWFLTVQDSGNEVGK